MAKDITNRREAGTTTDDAVSPLSPFRLGRTAIVYLRVLKPRETVLLSIIGLCTAVAAGGGSPPLDRFALAAIAIVVGSGGTNGLTNFWTARSMHVCCAPSAGCCHRASYSPRRRR